MSDTRTGRGATGYFLVVVPFYYVCGLLVSVFVISTVDELAMTWASPRILVLPFLAWVCAYVIHFEEIWIVLTGRVSGPDNKT